MNQKITSKNTSINSTKLPAIYNKINFSKFEKQYNVLDYGCGKFNNAKNFIESINGTWYGYDPYNRTEEENINTYNKYYDIIICSNVLNVISDEEIIVDIIENIYNKYFYCGNQKIFITVYEGDKSGIGKVTKKDCYQRNEKTIRYLKYLNKVFPDLVFEIKNGVITNHPTYIK